MYRYRRAQGIHTGWEGGMGWCTFEHAVKAQMYYLHCTFSNGVYRKRNPAPEANDLSQNQRLELTNPGTLQILFLLFNV